MLSDREGETLQMAVGYELRGTDDKGEGIFATRSFQIGETVMVGVIDREVDRNHSHASQVSDERFVIHGGLIPKVNHSCDPNCGIRLNASGAHNIVAHKSIVADQEITFDYAMRNYTVEYFPASCRCGSPLCRGRITGWKDLPAQRKANYRGFVAPYLIDIDSDTQPVRLLRHPPRPEDSTPCHEKLRADPGQLPAVVPGFLSYELRPLRVQNPANYLARRWITSAGSSSAPTRI